VLYNFKGRHPALITSREIPEWRDSLRRRKNKASTVAFKLSVIRSLYDFLRDAGMVNKTRWGPNRCLLPSCPTSCVITRLSAKP
jgi:site-specific recombinase XerD